MIKELALRLSPQTAARHHLLIERVSQELGIQQHRICSLRTLRKSIDARQRTIFINLLLRVFIDEEPQEPAFLPTVYPNVNEGNPVVIVGAGPAGLFAALRLIERGRRPILLERGSDVHQRRKDIALISTEHVVNSESNYAFGEGGAGAFSDGKLFTRSTKRGNVDQVLSVFCQHGADVSILSDVHPHIGTDRLPKVIENIRLTILKCGGEVHFNSCVNQILVNCQGKVEGVGCTNGKEYRGPVILATGHSARDVYRMLHRSGIAFESKGLAIGVRLEHEAHVVDQIMYHQSAGRGAYLPAAEYRMSAQCSDRGVYSFCMYPGGFVIPAASGPEQLVVNGMSPSGRNARWSNSGMVVETRTEDLNEPSLKVAMDIAMQDECYAESYGNYVTEGHPLRMMALQEALERQCWLQGGRRQTAPAQRMADFVNHRLSAQLPSTSYAPGIVASPLHFWMPEFIVKRLKEGFLSFGRRYHGFLSQEALMLAVETRTSSPVRINRHPETLEHISLQGLYPCGEGAGYAGGIVSAAIDGQRCADSIP